jgi:hypothetical protein
MSRKKIFRALLLSDTNEHSSDYLQTVCTKGHAQRIVKIDDNFDYSNEVIFELRLILMPDEFDNGFLLKWETYKDKMTKLLPKKLHILNFIFVDIRDLHRFIRGINRLTRSMYDMCYLISKFVSENFDLDVLAIHNYYGELQAKVKVGPETKYLWFYFSHFEELTVEVHEKTSKLETFVEIGSIKSVILEGTHEPFLDGQITVKLLPRAGRIPIHDRCRPKNDQATSKNLSTVLSEDEVKSMNSLTISSKDDATPEKSFAESSVKK